MQNKVRIDSYVCCNMEGWVSLLGEFMVTHYNQEGKFINLSNMAGQSYNNIKFDFNQVGFVRALFQAIANKFAEVFLRFYLF